MQGILTNNTICYCTSVKEVDVSLELSLLTSNFWVVTDDTSLVCGADFCKIHVMRLKFILDIVL